MPLQITESVLSATALYFFYLFIERPGSMKRQILFEICRNRFHFLFYSRIGKAGDMASHDQPVT